MCAMCRSMLQRVATHCNTLHACVQRIAARCILEQLTATPQQSATHFNISLTRLIRYQAAYI